MSQSIANPPDLSTDPQLLAFMTRVEGKRSAPYTDTKGFISIGIGRNLQGNPLKDDEIAYLFRNDVRDCCRVMDENIAWWRALNHDCQVAMVSLCFMGWETFRQFEHFLAAMKAMANGEGDQASIARAELRNSRWWDQVGQRGPLTAALIHQ